jgi:conjugal transfer pilus assembly protein TraF
VSKFHAPLALLATVISTAIYCAEPVNTVDAVGAATNSDELPSFWLRQQEGWFWYRDPPAPPTAQRPAPQNKDPRPKELIEFEAMQKRLDDLKRIAVMNPSDANMTAYMGYQRYVMDKSAYFADSWQRLVWKTPGARLRASGRPTNSFAIDSL